MQMVGPDWFQVEETVIAALKEENKVTGILINIVRKLLVTQRNLKKKKKRKWTNTLTKYKNKFGKKKKGLSISVFDMWWNSNVCK